MNNSRQLMLAWKFYCDDNSEKVPSAYGGAGDWWPFPTCPGLAIQRLMAKTYTTGTPT